MSNELAVVPNEPLGLENVDSSDLLLPRVILTQALSKFVQEDGMKAGVYVNSLTKKVIEDTTFQPLYASKYWDLLKPEGNKMVFEARVTDEHDERLVGRKMWSDEEGKANVNTVLAVIALIEGSPCVIPFTKTSYKAGKALLTYAKMNQGPFFSHKYKLVASRETTKGNSYYVTNVQDLGPVTEAEKLAAYALYQTLAPKATKINTAGLEADAIGDAQE